MQFVFQSLAWGFLLVLLPLLIHLINMLRYRRQRWAAMQFLLESYRRNKRWVWLKQALLLLTRMAVLAVLVAMLAQWVSGARLLSLLGQTVTHHYILLDDSMSMGQTLPDGTLYQRGLRSVSNLLDRSLQDGGAHQVTVIRFSRAAKIPSSLSTASSDSSGSTAAINAKSNSINADEIADVMSRSILGKSDNLFNSIQTQGTVDLDVSGQPAYELVQSLLTNAGGETPIVYLVSDFRQKEWKQPASIKASLQSLENLDAKIELVDCSSQNIENVTLISLEPDQEVLAAGVPVILRLAIKNQGANPLRNLTVRTTAYDFSSTQLNIAFDQYSSGVPNELPSIVIENLEPGETVTRGFQVVFPQSGSHVVSASLGDDALQADNRIACVLNLVESQRLLIVDDSANRTAAQYVRAAVDPGGKIKTGWQVQVESSAFLRDSQSQTLNGFASIFVVETNSLDERAVRNLREYVSQGGGVAFFPGQGWTDADAARITSQLSQSDSNSVSGQYNVKGALLPIQFTKVTKIESDSTAADIQQSVVPENHPVFAPLMNMAASPLQFVRVNKYVSVLAQSENSTGTDSQTISANSPIPARLMAALGNQAPLMLDHQFGDGRFVVGTSAINPTWSNWPQDPSFVVVMLKLAGYLASFRATATSQNVADVVRYSFSAQDFLPDAEMVYSVGREMTRQSLQVPAKPLGNRQLEVTWDPNRSIDAAAQQRSLFASTRELWLSSLSKGRQVTNFVANAPAREGELQRVEKSDLLASLRPLNVRYRSAENTADANPFSTASTQQNWLLGLLILLLLVEQMIAYLASYHLPKTKASKTVGVPG